MVKTVHRPISRNAFDILARVVSSFVSSKRPVWKSEIKFLHTYLLGYEQDESVVRSVLLESLKERNQLQILSLQLSQLKAEFAGDELERFWASVYRLCLSFADTREHTKRDVVSIGNLMGIPRVKLALMVSSIEEEAIPRLTS